MQQHRLAPMRLVLAAAFAVSALAAFGLFETPLQIAGVPMPHLAGALVTIAAICAIAGMGSRGGR